MRKILLILTLIALLITGCTQTQTEDVETTGDESTDELSGDISDFDELDSELDDLDELDLDDLDF